jgi:hypothetical protein
LTTSLPRLALALIVFLAWTPVAHAWSWPVQGPVLEPFSYDETHPYASGQHRGIDIGADEAGETVVAPAAGRVSFAGTVPTSGKAVTIATADGYSVTLTHLGSILVAKGADIAERDAVGTIGPSGTAEVNGPYVHLGIRLAPDPNGYVDPLGLLPPAADEGGTQSDSTASQPGANGGSAAAPASTSSASAAASSAPARTPVTATRTASASHAQAGASSRARGRPREGRGELRPSRSPLRPAVRAGEEAIVRTQRHGQASRPRASESASSWRRPVVETAAPAEPAGLGAGHEIRRAAPVARLSPAPCRTPGVLLPLLLNGAAALVALAAALAAARSRRRHRFDTRLPAAAAQVLHLPHPRGEPRRVPHAA